MNNTLRRTKIVATLGPACDKPGVLEAILAAGVDVVRLNFSHGSPEDHELRANQVRELAKKLNRNVAILGDLQGPKIRIARFKDSKIKLDIGDSFILDADLERDAGDQNRVGIDYKALPQDCETGDILLLDDGRVVLKVNNIQGSRIECVVTVGGILSNNKGINRQGGGLSAPALTDKDRADIITAAKLNLDYLAVSFPRCAEDMNLARKLHEEAGGSADMVAKIERAEAVADVETLDEIIKASDVAMVARGDLGVEIGDAELVGVQKLIIDRARLHNRLVITATQMMESMIDSPLPTRAEVSDVANAVLDGTDAVMLSAETAAGNYPEETVQAMSRIIMGVEKHPVGRVSNKSSGQFTRIDESIAMSAMYTANHLEGVKAIICFTESGFSTRLMSRVNSSLPIFAFSRHAGTRSKTALYRGVYTVRYDSDQDMNEEAIQPKAIELLSNSFPLEKGDLVILTKGDTTNKTGGTNGMKIIRVGDV